MIDPRFQVPVVSHRGAQIRKGVDKLEDTIITCSTCRFVGGYGAGQHSEVAFMCVFTFERLSQVSTELA